MENKITFILYDYEDLKTLINSKENISSIIALNLKIYTKAKEFFSDEILKVSIFEDKYKKKVIEESVDLENFFSKELNKIKHIDESTKFNLLLHFKILDKIILSYWYVMYPVNKLGIIYKNKIIKTNNKEKAIYYLLLSLYFLSLEEKS